MISPRKTLALLLAASSALNVWFALNPYRADSRADQDVINWLAMMHNQAVYADDIITDLASGSNNLTPVYPAKIPDNPAYIRKIEVISSREDLYAYWVWECGSMIQIPYMYKALEIPEGELKKARYLGKGNVELSGLPKSLEEDTDTDCLPDRGTPPKPSTLFISPR